MLIIISKLQHSLLIFALMIKVSKYLTHLSRMEFPTPVNWTSPFPNLGVSGVIFSFVLKIAIEDSVSKQ